MTGLENTGISGTLMQVCDYLAELRRSATSMD